MNNMNRRRFLNTSAALSCAALLGSSSCTISPQANIDSHSTTLFAEATTQANNPLRSNPETEPITNIVQAAHHFLDGLNDTQREKATYGFTSEERFRWHWTTLNRFPRNGLALREMNEEQKLRALMLLRSSLSQIGAEKVLNIMSLEFDLSSDPELYFVTIFGNPSTVRPWGWRWEGHHQSQHFTIVGNSLHSTPFFLGAWPTKSRSGVRPMLREEDAALELINSLGGEALETARFERRTLMHHVTQNQARVVPLDPVGLLYRDMSHQQQALVEEIIQTYLETQIEPIAQSSITRIHEAGLDSIRFGWAGNVESSKPQYYRLQGKTFLLEFDNSRDGGTHIHSVWRDFERDFGLHRL
ncbi:MAG: DUF3500 domain-containing protein [Chloroflexota bacterium]